MKSCLRFILSGLAALCVACGSLRAADTRYEPQLAPVFAAGEPFTYRATVEFQSLKRITILTKREQKQADGSKKMVRADPKSDTEQIHFTAILIADAALARSVYKNGSLQEAEFLVRRCEESDEKGDTSQLLPPGAIIGARKQADGQVAFAVNGQLPSQDLEARLSALISMGDEHATANELLGAPGPEPVGATWAVNEKAMLNSDLPHVFPGVDRVAGSVALRAAQPDKTGALSTTVTSTYQLGDVDPPFPTSDVIANPSDVRFEVVVTAPVAHGPGQYDLKSNFLMHHAGHSGDIEVGMSETDIEMGFTVNQEVHYTLGSASAPVTALAAAPPVPTLAPLPPGMSSAPVLRPDGPTLRPAVKSAQTSTAPTPTGPAPAQASPMPTTAKAPPPLAVPDGSPFSGAQELPSLPANTRQ